MPNCAQALEDAMKLFGEEYPRERDVREEVLEAFYEKHGDDSVPMEDEEDRIATELDDENGGFNEAADEFANKS